MNYRRSRAGDGWSIEVVVVENPDQALLTREIHVERRSGGDSRESHETHVVRTFRRREVEEALRGYGERRLGPQRLAFRARKGSAHG